MLLIHSSTMDMAKYQQMTVSLNDTSYRTQPPEGKSFWSTMLSTIAQNLPNFIKDFQFSLIIKPTRCTNFSNLFLE
jgi:hypothetical protein